MPYKTVSIKLLTPTRTKRTILDNAITRYSTAFEILLQNSKDIIPVNHFSKVSILKLMDKEFFSPVSHLDIEPFKDALKLDLAKLISIYKSQKTLEQKTRYPVTRTESSDISDFLNNNDNISHHQLDSLFEKFKNKRPLLFCRFDDKRDYSIVKRENGTFFAKLFLFSRKNAIDGKRYILFPLKVADWQNKFLSDMYSAISTAKSAELIEKNGEYFLNVRFWYEAKEKQAQSNYIGIARGVNNDLCYAISDKNGEILDAGSLNAKNVNGKNKLHALSNQIISLALDHKCQIVMANLSTRNDGLKYGDIPIDISVGNYNQLISLVGYKAELSGLHEPVLVSANSIFYRCPKCSCFKKVNRFGSDKFICVMCGYSNELEYIGSTNLAKTLVAYKKNKVPVYYFIRNNEFHFRIDMLNYEFSCAESDSVIDAFYANLQDFLTLNINNFTKSQQFLAKKIVGEKARSKINFIETK